MPKRKAECWPASIYQDEDVLSLDEDGRFVLCRVCHVHYAVHGGKKPKPVIMNSSFRTRAWEVHKERTNSHRMQRAALLHDPVAAAAAAVAGSVTTASLAPLLSPTVDGSHTAFLPSTQRAAASPLITSSSVVQPVNAQVHSNRSSPSSSAVGNAGRFTPAIEPNTRPMSPQQTSAAPSRYIDMQSSMASSTGGHSFITTSRDQRSASRSSDALSAAVSKENRSEQVGRFCLIDIYSVVLEQADLTDAFARCDQNDHRIRRLTVPDASSSSSASRAVNPLRSERRTASIASRDAGSGIQTQDLAGNNERVAQTLKILDDEYNANAFLRRMSAGAPDGDNRQYWKNLRSVYSKSSSKKQRRSHRSSDGVTTSSTPDDSGGMLCSDVNRVTAISDYSFLIRLQSELDHSTSSARVLRNMPPS